MASFEDVLRAVEGLQAAELERWVTANWVAPAGEAEDWRFTALDVARVRLIVELRHDLAVEEETLPLVLSLLDQVYTLRRQVRTLKRGIDAQPEAVRRAIRTACEP